MAKKQSTEDALILAAYAVSNLAYFYATYSLYHLHKQESFYGAKLGQLFGAARHFAPKNFT